MAATIDKRLNKLENTLSAITSCVRFTTQNANERTDITLSALSDDLYTCRKLAIKLEKALQNNRISNAIILSNNLEVLQRNITVQLRELKNFQNGANEIVSAINSALESHS